MLLFSIRTQSIIALYLLIAGLQILKNAMYGLPTNLHVKQCTDAKFLGAKYSQFYLFYVFFEYTKKIKLKTTNWWLRRTLILITASSTIFFFKRFFIMVGFFLIGSSSSTSTEPKNLSRNIEPGPRLVPKMSSESSVSLPKVPAFLQPAWWFSTYAHVQFC